MDYQLPQQMPIGPPTPAPSPHIQIMQNSPQILPSMQPPNSLPNMPLQVIHLPHMNPPNGAQNGGGASQQHNSQNLPPPSQILQVHHQTNGTNGTPNGQTPNGGPNGGMNGNNGANGVNGEEGNRWTQFQVQQLWRHHAYLNGKSGNSKDICGDDKHKEDGDPWNVEAQAAFLGPNLWDKTLPYDADLKYVDLDEFLSENNIPVDGLPGGHLGHSNGLGHRSDSLGHSAGLSLGLSQVTTKRERSPSPSDCVSPDTMNPPSPAESIFDVAAFSFASSGRDFDPRTRAFSDEELKPQPMIKKSRKQFVPEELKDDKYWARRRKNNIAAKRSRDARRQKENQIAMRARYLEKENMSLQQEVDQLRQENLELRSRLSKYQEV
ncbi:hepatic leukemia factor isoform X2 [Lutzomyia longipalpis]|uniref:hepatic leukemia factor isoform X2 n=1 Tax=Lutzomyia longipalpis TaxID=7200 RepID=UPI0024837D6D|nr:hepatic leukemia factor isoform X2 [Lutzomyia longipalpis]